MAQDEMTLTYKLQQIARTNPEREIFVSYGHDMNRSALTAGEFYTLCARFSHILKQDGVKPGDYVATAVPLSLEAIVVYFGTIFAGAIPSNMEITMKSGEGFLQSLQKLRPRLLIAQDEPWNQELKYCKTTMEISLPSSSATGILKSPGVPSLEKIRMVRRSDQNGQSFLDLLRTSKEEYVCEMITRETVCWNAWTTGNETDIIRITDYTHDGILKICDNYAEVKKSPCKKKLYTNPFHWVTAAPFDILIGKTRVIPDKWVKINEADYPLMLVKIIKSEGVQHGDIQPLQMRGVLKLLDEHTGGKPLLEYLDCGGMPVTQKFMETIRPLARNFTILYGSHEIPVISSNRITAEEIKDFQDFDNGTLAKGIQVRLVDVQGQEVPPGQKGRALYKTDAMFCRYSNKPEDTATRFNNKGWFVTNDQVRIDINTKHVFIGGRIDTILVFGQYMCYPSLPESLLSGNPAIAQVAVVPVPDDVLFHGIGICVIRKKGLPLSQEDIINEFDAALVPGKLEMFSVKIIAFFETFPTKPDGSVDRPRLSDILAERCEKGEGFF